MSPEKVKETLEVAKQELKAAVRALERAQQHDYPGHVGALTQSAESSMARAERLIERTRW